MSEIVFKVENEVHGEVEATTIPCTSLQAAMEYVTQYMNYPECLNVAVSVAYPERREAFWAYRTLSGDWHLATSRDLGDRREKTW